MAFTLFAIKVTAVLLASRLSSAVLLEGREATKADVSNDADMEAISHVEPKENETWTRIAEKIDKLMHPPKHESVAKKLKRTAKIAQMVGKVVQENATESSKTHKTLLAPEAMDAMHADLCHVLPKKNFVCKVAWQFLQDTLSKIEDFDMLKTEIFDFLPPPMSQMVWHMVKQRMDDYHIDMHLSTTTVTTTPAPSFASSTGPTLLTMVFAAVVAATMSN